MRVKRPALVNDMDKLSSHIKERELVHSSLKASWGIEYADDRYGVDSKHRKKQTPPTTKKTKKL